MKQLIVFTLLSMTLFFLGSFLLYSAIFNYDKVLALPFPLITIVLFGLANPVMMMYDGIRNISILFKERGEDDN
jgi:uncharacterized SAM-binding protein YcdF (DUF218 family)